MTDIIIYIIVLIISLLIVIKAADIFVDSLVEIGESLGISQIILGVTASAIGTSLPEFGSAMIAVFSGSPDIGVGVVIGSNIWNIAGILGISSVFAGFICVQKEEMKRDGLMTLLTAVILLFFMFFLNEITRIVGFILVVVYIIYLWLLIKAQKKHSKNNSETSNMEDINSWADNGVELESSNIEEDLVEVIPNNSVEEDVVEEIIKSSRSRNKNILITLLGLSGLIIGCRIMVWSGVEIATIANIPQMIIGLFALAIGTSMPELVVTLRSAMKKLHSLSIGTVLGSNIFNILIGIGIPSLFMSIPVEKLSISFDAPVMIFVTALLLILSYRHGKLTRRGGILLLCVYIAYIGIRLYISI